MDQRTRRINLKIENRIVGNEKLWRKNSLFSWPGGGESYSKQRCVFETEEMKKEVWTTSNTEERKKMRKFNGKAT